MAQYYLDEELDYIATSLKFPDGLDAYSIDDVDLLNPSLWKT
jgi:hypothetical protein